MFLVKMSHEDANTDRSWSIRIAKGGSIYSFIGPFGESIPPNTKSGMQFVDEVNQKVAVDSWKNNLNSDQYFIHQSGVYQNSDPGFTDVHPFWFSPNLAVHCLDTIPECRLASWGQQSYERRWTERIIYYERFRDCGDGVLEQTSVILNAEDPKTNTTITFSNVPWGGSRYSKLKDIAFSVNPSAWNYWENNNLPGGIEDPMRYFGLDEEYGFDRYVRASWTLGYTIFTEDLPYVGGAAPNFVFPGRFPPEYPQLNLRTSYGNANTKWICQGPLGGYVLPSQNNIRCRIAYPGKFLPKSCMYCNLRFTNPSGQYISVWNVRNWVQYDGGLKVYMIYFNSNNSIQDIRAKFINNTPITVSWEENGKSANNNYALSFIHGISAEAVAEGQVGAKMRFGLAGAYERDFAVFEYITYPQISFGEAFRSRKYYITDKYAGLSTRSLEFVDEVIEERIDASSQFESYSIHLHSSASSSVFGSSFDDFPCESSVTTTFVCTGSSTPQAGKSAFLQIVCGGRTYVGTNFYWFSNYPTRPYRRYNCKIFGKTTSVRPIVKLIGFFNANECGSTLQNKVYDSNFCTSE